MRTTLNHSIQIDHGMKSAIDKHLSDVKVITLLGKDMKIADVGRVYQDHIDAVNAATAAKVAWQAAVEKERSKADVAHATTAALQSYAEARFGRTSPVLEDFGVKPKKARAKLTIEERMLAVERARATRRARNTLGKREKQSIHGDVPGLTVTPTPTPVTATPSASGSGTNGSNGSTTKTTPVA